MFNHCSTGGPRAAEFKDYQMLVRKYIHRDGSAWVLVQKKRRTQADLLQGTKTSELQGKTTQRKPTTSRPPPLPLHDYKAILRPLGGLRLDQWSRPTLTRAIGVAASLPPAEVDRLVFRLRPEQNLAVISTPHEHIALNLYSVQHLRLGEHTYPVSIYIAAPDNSCKGIIYGVDPGTSPSELMDHLITPGHTVLQARMMGKTSTALITFEGLQVPHYIRYYGAEYRCYVHRPRKQVCTVCLRLGHRSDNCPTPNCVTCETCGVDNPTPGHSCTPKCRSCGGDHPTTDTGCPARVRPPLNKERVRKALQQEQLQRDVEHHSTPSSSTQGELQAAGPNPGRTSRSRSRSRRRSRSKARSRTHSRTGSQTPPVKRATTSEATGPLVTNQPSLPLKDFNQPDKNQGAEQRPAEPREVSWAKGPPLLSPSSATPSRTLASAPQTTQNPDPNALHQLRAEMEVKLRALDARLRREIEAACTTIRQEFRDMLNQAVSTLKDTLNDTVATLHNLISSSISTLSTDIQQQTERNMQQMRQEFAPALTLAPITKRSHPYTRPSPLRSEDGDA
ncbi:hypothetical protein HPB52_010954 [Rhipicephalus sanguineus]|uniref:CCHC-type domain-containing protein n=1 Tax=Rhipicephalus sanguineus TaxID=34632 RepID=A0A9D4Q0D4_RHISA|nr:hypothetical protein HPB52_010954 [Rhipicephalus sanguineus]